MLQKSDFHFANIKAVHICFILPQGTTWRFPSPETSTVTPSSNEVSQLMKSWEEQELKILISLKPLFYCTSENPQIPSSVAIGGIIRTSREAAGSRAAAGRAAARRRPDSRSRSRSVCTDGAWCCWCLAPGPPATHKITAWGSCMQLHPQRNQTSACHERLPAVI